MKRYVQVILGQYFLQLTEGEKDYMAGFSKTQLLPTLHVCVCRLCPMSLGTELSAVIFGQHVHMIFIPVIFLLKLFEGQSL
jgi:hypothetical protein